MPLDHLSVPVPQDQFENIITFLTTSLQHLGFKEMFRPVPTLVGMGETTPYFWVNAVDTKEPAVRRHIAFSAENTKQVKDFYAAALKAGATSNGEPGLRNDYHPGYYGAFVIHPGSNINFEVVCHNGA
ncbi:hypothetical protein OIDMADRAFT_15973 [Oidiodendron maius Zn]|uniref:VOC domain-containing protein n=1 Tax=Oidiodendron maius (strain Zn) TaxID=913774 RepID=A0A0C3HVI9_OIDMZ|nr:hypothetical protein OIDMADRAFT_15973 [Oidiodendron maius Zn]